MQESEVKMMDFNVPELTQEQKVQKILKCQCINCGGHLEKVDNETYVCKYCSTQYTVKKDYSLPTQPYVINVMRLGTRVLGARFFLSNEHKKLMGEEDSIRYIRRHIIDSICDYLNEHFDEFIELEEDRAVDDCYMRMGTEYRASMRMLEKPSITGESYGYY